MAGLTGKRWPIVGKRLHMEFPYIDAEVGCALLCILKKLIVSCNFVVARTAKTIVCEKIFCPFIQKDIFFPQTT